MKVISWRIALTVAILAGAAIVFIALGGYGLQYIPEGRFLPEIVLPVILLFGVLVMLFGLVVVITAFSALGLSDSKFALALPEGSVRAMIALLLIVMFAITSVFLYRELTQMEDLEPSIRFAEQILTTISTLVVAVAGFYFGTRAVTAAQGQTSEEPPLPE